MEEKKVLAIVAQPGEAARIVPDFNTALEAMQEFVGGWIELSYPTIEGVVVLGNDEAKLIGLEGNRRIGGGVYAGPIAFLGEDEEGEFRNLTEDEVLFIMNEYGEAQHIATEEVQADCGFFVFGDEDEEGELLKRVLLDAYFAGGGKYDY